MLKICSNFLVPRLIKSTVFSRALAYKSDVSLDVLYPKSRLHIYAPKPPTNVGNKFCGYIPINELEISYCRSSGPGGQHVNTVNTKVDLRFKLAEANWIPEQTRQKLLQNLHNKITKDGYYVIKSDVTRSQHLNLADALEKLRALIRSFEVEAAAPTAATLEKHRRRQERAARERLQLKRQRAETKAQRQGPTIFEV